MSDLHKRIDNLRAALSDCVTEHIYKHRDGAPIRPEDTTVFWEAVTWLMAQILSSVDANGCKVMMDIATKTVAKKAEILRQDIEASKRIQ